MGGRHISLIHGDGLTNVVITGNFILIHLNGMLGDTVLACWYYSYGDEVALHLSLACIFFLVVELAKAT